VLLTNLYPSIFLADVVYSSPILPINSVDFDISSFVSISIYFTKTFLLNLSLSNITFKTFEYLLPLISSASTKILFSPSCKLIDFTNSFLNPSLVVVSKVMVNNLTYL